MAKERLIKLPQTKGMFKVMGKVSGVGGDKFFTELKTKTGKDGKKVKFMVETKEGEDGVNKVPVELTGYEKENVYFFRNEDLDHGIEKDSKAVAWRDRLKFKQKGYNLLGTRVGLEKDEEGKNKQKVLVEFDAADYISKHLQDDQSVFVKGDIDYSESTGESGTRLFTRYQINQLSACKKDIDFESENFKEGNAFKQTFVYTGIEKAQEEGKYIISGLIVGYQNITHVEFTTYKAGLARTFKKKIRPYTAITVWGYLDNRVIKEEVEESDDWGEADTFDTAGSVFINERVITGADKDSIDKDTYSQDKVEEAIKAIKEFGESAAKVEKKDNKKDDDDFGDDDFGFDDDEDIPF